MNKLGYNRIYTFAFTALVLSLPFSMALPNILLALIAVLFLLKVKEFPFREVLQTPSLPYLIFLFYLTIKALLTGTFITEFYYYDLFFIVAMVPLLVIRVTDRRTLKKAFLVAINASIVVSMFYAAKFYFLFGYLPYTEGWLVNWTLVLERPYAGFTSIVSILVALDLSREARKWKWAYYASIVVAAAFIFFISARLSIGTLVGLAILYTLFYTKLSLVKKFAGTAAVIALVALALAKSESLAMRFFIKDDVATSIETAAELEPRAVIWPCAWDMTKNEEFSWLTGFSSFSELPANFRECYKKIENVYTQKYFVSKLFNSHNQFIEIFLVGGAIGLLLFCSFLAALGWSSRKDFFALAILISSVLFFTFENVLYRQFGAFIFSTITAIYIWPSIRDEKS